MSSGMVLTLMFGYDDESLAALLNAVTMSILSVMISDTDVVFNEACVADIKF